MRQIKVEDTVWRDLQLAKIHGQKKSLSKVIEELLENSKEVGHGR